MKLEIYKKDGTLHSRLNQRLIESKGISEESVEKIKRLHTELLDVYDQMEEAEGITLKRLFKQTTQIEYQLQIAWKFKRNKKFHNWFMVPKCTCPKMDNREAQGYLQIISSDCPVHS